MAQRRSSPLAATGTEVVDPAELAPRGHLKPGVPLTKHQVQMARTEERGFKDLQNQKLDSLEYQVSLMNETFDQARRNRERLKKMYEERHQDVLAQLSQMRGQIDQDCSAMHRQLKDFSISFEGGVEQGKREWKERFSERVEQIDHRLHGIGKELTRLNASLEQEKVDRQADQESAIAPIRAALDKHEAFLAQTTAERQAWDAAYCERFEELFVNLRRKIADETVEREKQARQFRVTVERHFNRLKEQREVEDEAIMDGLRALRAGTAFEEEERSMNQNKVVNSMVNFMDQFEESIKENHRRQQEAKRDSQAMILDETQLPKPAG